jgi:hypothetical protein
VSPAPLDQVPRAVGTIPQVVPHPTPTHFQAGRLSPPHETLFSTTIVETSPAQTASPFPVRFDFNHQAELIRQSLRYHPTCAFELQTSGACG